MQSRYFLFLRASQARVVVGDVHKCHFQSVTKVMEHLGFPRKDKFSYWQGREEATADDLAE